MKGMVCLCAAYKQTMVYVMSETHEVNEDNQNENNDAKQDTEQIIQTGSITAKGERGLVHCLTIIGQIEGHMVLPPQNKTTKYEHVIPQLAAIEESPEIEGLIILINTVGGDVEAGLAIAELITSMKKPTVSIVLGGGHSIGVPLAVAAKRSFIVPSATMTIHPVRFNGIVIGAPQTFNYFEKMQERIVRFVTSNSRISEERFRGYIMKTGEMASDVGSVIDGADAVEVGLIDELGGLSQALDCLHKMIDEKHEQNKPKKTGKKANKPAQKEGKSE